ncbi:hypothetical protein TBS_05270 [Thermobispora bispora]|uniref:hypothetical protein n=1 Tax=Thermobispora bispora TaxID=2006 RepID=UPI0030E9B6B3
MTTVLSDWELAALLDRLESEWGPKLSSVSLITELEVDRRTLDAVARALGHLYRLRVEKRRHRSFFDRWPACIAVTLTGVAAHRYQRGTYWPYLWEALDCAGRPDLQDATAWGKAYLATLERFGLPVLDDPQRYVGPILMHAGIPTYCLRDFFTLLVQRRRQDPTIDAGTLLSWATDRPGRLGTLDKPAQNFIRFGTDYALDVIDRCLDLLDRLHSPDPDLSGLGLPARFLDRAQELAREGELDLIREPAPGRGRRRVEPPHLAIDPYGQGVQIVLPPIGEAPDGTARWQVIVDGVPTVVKSRALWVGAAEGAPATTFPLPRPARSAQVSLYGTAHETHLDIVDPGDPLLIFSEDGRHVSPRLGVPPDQIWVLHPRDRDLASDGEIRVVTESPLPIGWGGWRLALVEPAGATWVGLSGGRHRPIRGYSRPRVITSDPVPGVTTPYGSPVHAAPPRVWLPAEATLTWHVDIRPAAGGPAVFTGTFTVGEPVELGEELWAGLSRPLLGAFEITVRGPIGRSTRRTVVIAEGLTAAYHPRVRLFTPEGLAPGRAVLTAGPGMTVEPATPEYAPGEREHVVTCTTASESEPLLVSPPQMRVLLERRGESPKWSSRPVRLAAEFFAEAESLRVDLPGADTLPPLELHAGGQCVQRLTPQGGRYDLTQAQDTVARYRSADLVLSVPGYRLPIGYVRPARLASGVTASGDRLILDECVWVDGLTAGVYLYTAPWRGPELIPVERDGSIPLPPALQHAGPLHVRLAVEDPWAPAEWPRWPKPSELLACPMPGHYSGADAEERWLSGYLAGAKTFPPEVTRLDRLWAIVDLANRVDYAAAGRWIGHCAAALRRDPEALRHLPAAGLPPDRTVVAVITTGLAAGRTAGFRESDVGLWRTAPVAAALLSSPVLPEIADHPDLRAEVEAVCGAAAMEILLGRGDPYPHVGKFDRAAEVLARHEPERLEELWSAAQVVPKALLDVDTRMAAARALFDRRNSRDARTLAEVSAHLIRHALTALRGTRLRGLERYVTERCDPDRLEGWVSLPAVSIACALLARAAARGHEGCRDLEERFRPLWRMLAKLAPDLTAIDLIRAEFLIAASEDHSPPSGVAERSMVT